MFIAKKQQQSHKDKQKSFPGVVAIAIGIAIAWAIFGVHALVVSHFFGDLDQDSLDLFKTMRDIGIILLGGGVVGTVLVRHFPPLWVAKQVDQNWQSSIVQSKDDQLKHFIRWFIWMRWLAIFVSIILSYITVQVLHFLPQEVWMPLFVTSMLLACCNVYFGYLLRKGMWQEFHLSLQVYVDLVFLTVLLHFSSGIENPLSLLMFLHVIIAGILLRKDQCYRVAAVASVLFAIMAFAELADVVEHYRLMLVPHGEGNEVHAAHQTLYVVIRVCLQFGILHLLAYFVSKIANQARSYETQLEEMNKYSLTQRLLLEQSLDTTKTGLCIIDRARHPLWQNTTWLDWFTDADPSTMIQDPKSMMEAVHAAFSTGDSSIHEWTLNNPDAEGVFFQVAIAPILNQDRSIREVALLAQDISQQKLVQAKMMQTGKMAALGELAGNVAHEVNNPIAIISAKVRLMLMDSADPLPQKAHEELEKVIHLSDRVADIAKNLLSYCRGSSSATTALNIQIPVCRALDFIRQSAKSKDIELVESFDLPNAMVMTNANEMEQVFLNLFINAMDAMPDGGSLTVQILGSKMSSVNATDCIDIVVTDTGIGIDSAITDKIFDPFFTTKDEEQGTGLGLSVCIGLVRSHGGEIFVDSTINEGTRFTVRLPVYLSNVAVGNL